MARDRIQPGVAAAGGSRGGAEPDLEADDELIPVTRESSRGGNEPPPEVNDRPEQNVAYDEVVKGAPLSAEERERAKRESPLSD